MYIKVRVFSDAPKEHIEQEKPDLLRVWVREPPKRGLANRRVLELVGRHFSYEPKRLRIVKGHQSPSKIIQIPDTP